jgi:hypothetical protein
MRPFPQRFRDEASSSPVLSSAAPHALNMDRPSSTDKPAAKTFMSYSFWLMPISDLFDSAFGETHEPL